MRLPAQGEMNASMGSGNISFGSSNLTTYSGTSAEYDNRVILSDLAFWGVYFGSILFFYLLGAIVASLSRRRLSAKGYVKINHDARQEAFSGQEMLAPDGNCLLSPQDDEWTDIGTVQLKLACTRRQLLEA